MTITTKNDKHTMVEILFTWLVGAGLNGFKFDTEFSIYFTRDKSASFKGYELPWFIELHLLGDWWFGSLEDWRDKVARLGQGVEPDEPVKASELALLRWSKGAVIEDINFTNQVMTIVFENKTTLSVSLKCEDEYVFMAHEKGVNEEDRNWSVTCDGENYFYRAKTSDCKK